MKTLLVLLVLSGSVLGQVTISDPRFAHDFIYFGNGLTTLDFDSDGHIIAAEKQGRVVRFMRQMDGNYSDTPLVLLDLTTLVNPALERGLLGLELDPDFATNRLIYLLYSTDSEQRIVRYQFNADLQSIDPASALLILAGLPNMTQFHKAGDIHFRPGDAQSLFVALGDDDLISEARDLDSYAGKILRIDKTTGMGFNDNPFFDGNLDSVRSRVWISGLRNPFRFTFNPDLPDPEVMYISENGDGTDRITWALRGSDGNWDLSGDGAVGCPGGCFLDPADPNHRVMMAIEPSQIGIAIATSGPFAANGLPTLYASNWFPGVTGINRWQLSGTDLDQLTDIPIDAGGLFAPLIGIDLKFGPDGCLYLGSTGGDASIDNGSLERVCFVNGQPPVADFITDIPLVGAPPLTVNFTSQASDSDGQIIRHAWDFGDGTMSSETNPTHTFMQAGDFTVRLTVADDTGLVDFVEQPATIRSGVQLNLDFTIINVGSGAPAAPSAPLDLAFFGPDQVSPVALDLGHGPDSNRLTTDGSGQLTSTVFASLAGDQLVVTVNPDGAAGLASTTAGFAIDLQSTNDLMRQFNLAATMINGQVTSTTGVTPSVDVGVFDAQGAPFGFFGGRDVFPPAPPTGVDHRLGVDALGFFQVPIDDAAQGGAWLLRAPGDTGEDQFAAVQDTVAVTLGQSNASSILLGVFDAGQDCDDLSAIPVAPPEYETIQTLFSNQCTGCHTPAAPNSGGLDLTRGHSLHELSERTSAFAPGVELQSAQGVTRSYLFEKVNCATPQTGDRMRPTNAMSLADQALIRDWINDHIVATGFE